MDKKYKIILLIFIFCLVMTVGIGASFAYYTAVIDKGEESKTIISKSANLEITYTDGSKQIIGANIYPGWSDTKTFTVKNTGDADSAYAIKLTNIVNKFTVPGSISFSWIANGGPADLDEYILPTFDSRVTIRDITFIGVGETHEYTLTTYYKNVNYDQTEDKGKSFSYTIEIEGVKSWTPKGWNTAAICIEIYGNFDKDEMKAEQKKAVIGCYALLAKKFNIPISAEGIRPHCWFTAGGAYIGDYNKSKSAKTCPGLKFFGGNTKASFEKNFYPAVRNYGKEEIVSEFKPYVAKVIYEGSDGLNVRKGPGTSYEVTAVIHHGEAYTIVEEKNGWGKLKSGVGWISLNSKYIQKI